jgi:hypothetical protein
MPSDAERCREHATECSAWAARTNNPSLKESLTDLAKRWTRLATELEATRVLFEEIGRVSHLTRETGPISMVRRQRETGPISMVRRQAVKQWPARPPEAGRTGNGRPQS